MAEKHTITISDLLSLSRPLTGTASLFPSSHSPPLKKHKHYPPSASHTDSLTSLLLHNRNPKVSNPEHFFTPVNRPVFLEGTVDLPADPFDPFLSFSDGFSTICCDVLDFDLKIIGCKVHVLAWNFLPLKKHQSGGILEVIQWSILPSFAMSKDKSSPSLRKGIVGDLRSVSPVFTVPCQNQASDADSIGFLAEISTCKCSFCVKPFSVDVYGYSHWKLNTHSFTSHEFVYFLKPSSRWRPALSKLVGKVIMVTGLEKKMIYVGEKKCYAMFVTTLETNVSCFWFPLEDIRLIKGVRATMIEEGTVYNGVITGIYMQGMAVELDDRAWLLVTDPDLASLAALRVGAVISVKNFQLVNPEFSWIEANLLVSCCRTIIEVKAFSSDARCHFRSHNQSLLGKFIESLIPSARFWVLLLISCFRRKFSKILSDKEILGSRNKEGLVQFYARATLLSHFFQPQSGMFMEFCKRGQSAIKHEMNRSPLKLVVPISNLIRKCEMLWVSLVLKMQSSDGKPTTKNNVNQLPCDGISPPTIIRRIISSDILGCTLIGFIKSTSLGKLQLFDASGSVDVVIPDIHSGFHCQGIHEVKEFKVVLEGPSMQLESFELHFAEPLAFSSIFRQIPLKQVLKQLTVYVYFHLKDSTCLNAPVNLPQCHFNKCNSIGRGIAHLLFVTHKFPAADTYLVDTNASQCSSLFAEALLLPYDAIFLDEDVCNHPSDNLLKLSRCPAYASKRNKLEIRCGRKPKFVESSSWDSLNINYYLNVAEGRPGFPCLLKFASNSRQIHQVPGYLCYKGGSMMENKSVGLGPVLLEFLSCSFVKYQSLQLGGYYIVKCSKECSLCSSDAHKKLTCSKVFMSSETTLWKVSFSFEIIKHQREQPCSWPSEDYLIGDDQPSLGNVYQNDLVFQQSCAKLNVASDVNLVILHHKFGLFNRREALEEGLFKHCSMLPKVLPVSSLMQIMKSDMSRSLSCAGPHHGSLLVSILISVCGDIESVHLYNCKSGPFLSKENAVHSHGRDAGICLHVYDDKNMIKIRGKLHNYAYPVGMGPGVNATFHRVLLKCFSGGSHKLILNSVSFIVINSVKETSFQSREIRSTLLPQFDMSSEESIISVSLSLISQFIRIRDIKLAPLLCRVATIHFLVLEKHELGVGRSTSRSQLKIPVKIPLAGFLLDDGSSLCCCWADAERAEKLLRLDEILCQTFVQCGVSSVEGSVKYHDTIGYLLDKMLRKHNKVIVKNYRAAPDVSAVDFMFYVDAGEVFSNAEENLLRFVIINACQGSNFNVVGHLMDTNDLSVLHSECEELQDVEQPLQNIWAAEIESINYLKQARNLFDDLSTG